MTHPISGNWNLPTNIRFGPGVISQLATACKKLSMRKPLLITDEGLAKLPMVKDAIAANESDGLPTGLYSGVQGNPTGSNVDGGIAAYRAGGHDGVIAFGGGSALDAAKAVALMVAQDRPLWDFEDIGDNWKRVKKEGLAPVVAVPTTSGTGSEVGRSSVITNEEIKVKKIIFHPTMLPAVVLSDPELTVGLPPHITAATGIDAFVHCFEALCAKAYHPMADGIALEGMRLVAEALPRAYDDGTDIEARAHMLAAASMGATAFQKGLGGVSDAPEFSRVVGLLAWRHWRLQQHHRTRVSPRPDLSSSRSTDWQISGHNGLARPTHSGRWFQRGQPRTI